MQESFINRDNNFANFNKVLSKTTNYEVPLVFLVYGYSGVGKSFFANELIQRNSNYIGVKVVIPGTTNAPENYYIERIAQSLDSLAFEFNYPSFFSFFQNKSIRKKGSEYLKALRTIVLKENFWGKILKETIDFLSFDNNEEIKQKVFSSKSSEIQVLLQEYIDFIITNYSIILNVENIQNIDSTSLDYLNNIIPDAKRSLFIFEYTISRTLDENKGIFEIYAVFNDLISLQNQSKLLFAASYLKEMDKDDVIKIVNQYGISESFDSLFVNYDGDLRLLRHLQITYLRDKKLFRESPHIIDYRKYHLEQLGKDQLYILALIIIHKGIIPYDQLYFINEYEKSQSFLINIDADVDELLNEDLITINESNTIYIKHDSTSDSFLKNEKFSKVKYIAFNTWINYYERILAKSDYKKVTEENALTMLFHLYYNYTPERLEGIFKRIKKYIFKNIIHPVSARNFIIPLSNNLSSSTSTNKKNRLEIFNLFYSLNMYEDAHNILKKIIDHDTKYYILLAANLNRKNENQRALDIIKNQLHITDSPKTKLQLNIIKLISLRSLNYYAEMQKVYNEVMSNYDFYGQEKEYGYFLRVSEVCLSPKEAIENLILSIKFFEGDNIEKSNSQVTLAIYYIRTGMLQEAKELLLSAKLHLYNRITERHVIKNNLAVIGLYEGDIDIQIEQVLFDALITGVGIFNRIVILNNLLVYYCICLNESKAQNCVDKILSLIEREVDKALLRTCYYNIAYFYRTFNCSNQSNEYMQKSIDEHLRIVNATSLFWNSKLGIGDTYNGAYNFLVKHDFYLPTISNWGIPIDIEGD